MNDKKWKKKNRWKEGEKRGGVVLNHLLPIPSNADKSRVVEKKTRPSNNEYIRPQIHVCKDVVLGDKMQEMYAD